MSDSILEAIASWLSFIGILFFTETYYQFEDTDQKIVLEIN